MRKYKAIYTDTFGVENIEISSDGSIMHLPLRGVIFDGVDFELLTGDKVEGNKFHYEIANENDHFLTNFRIKVTFPIHIEHQQKVTTEQIIFTILVGDQDGIQGQESIGNTVVLNTSFGQFTSTAMVDFEDSLIEIQNKLPKGTDIKACVSCKYSTYNPFGNVSFGDLSCFRNIKERLHKIEDKHSLLEVWDKAYKEGKTFKVQEIFICPEHEYQTKADWMYKSWADVVE